MIKVKEKLKIGLFGTRAKHIETVIKEFKFQYHQILEDISKLDHTFNLALGSGVYDIVKKEILDIPKYGFMVYMKLFYQRGKDMHLYIGRYCQGKKCNNYHL